MYPWQVNKGLLKSSKLFFIKFYFFKYFSGKGVPCINIFITYIYPLEILVGRYKKIPRHQRLCKTCKVLDDEIHFFLQCRINNNLRK
jgi:hypothetical protein